MNITAELFVNPGYLEVDLKYEIETRRGIKSAHFVNMNPMSKYHQFNTKHYRELVKIAIEWVNQNNLTLVEYDDPSIVDPPDDGE